MEETKNEVISLSLDFVYWYTNLVYNVAADILIGNLIKITQPIVIQPVTHGEWVECESADYNYCCSNCGYGYTDNRLSYCYDCGAKMEND